jgi:ATP phosphoribosyltransferase
MNEPALLLAVPSKGRLQEHALAFFAQAGLPLVQPRGARDYRGAISNVPAAQVLFLSASEIARELGAGRAHLGITGEDLIREQIADADARVSLLEPLRFGSATVVVAAPQAWIDVATMADLDDVATHMRLKHGRPLRVATKYISLTRSFFTQHGITDYRIVESPGATEGAPGSGMADVIVDITTSGATLAANALKVLDDGVILRSQANLVASLTAPWTDESFTAARTILARLGAAAQARNIKELRALPRGNRTKLAAEAATKFRATTPFGIPAEGPLVLHVPAQSTYMAADWLMLNGAETVTVSTFDDVFEARNPLYARLRDRLALSV